MSKYVYQRTGGPLWSWRRGAPRQAAPASIMEMGSYLGDASVIRPGSPEPLTGAGESVETIVKLGVVGAILWGASKILGGRRRKR